MITTNNLHIGTEELASRKKGRPLSFDRDAALYQAMLLFWRHGYEATTLTDLTNALGVAPSSIYSAFSDKKGVFLEAVALYHAGPTSSETASDAIIAHAATARDAALGLLQAAAKGFTGEDTPPGCLLASSAISCSVGASDVQDALAAIRRGIEARLRQKIVDSIEAGLMPGDSDADTLAGHIMAVIQGMSTLARDGATRKKLLAVAETAIRVWPH